MIFFFLSEALKEQFYEAIPNLEVLAVANVAVVEFNGEYGVLKKRPTANLNALKEEDFIIFNNVNYDELRNTDIFDKYGCKNIIFNYQSFGKKGKTILNELDHLMLKKEHEYEQWKKLWIN